MPDPAPSWRSPSLEELKAMPRPPKSEEVPPRRLSYNRRMRRDFERGRCYLQRSVRRGFGLPWVGNWPPVWQWDIVPFLHMHRAHSEQSMRWASDVVVTGLETGDDLWTVTVGDRKDAGGLHDWLLRGLRKAGHQLLAAEVRASLRARRHVRTRPTRAP